MTSRRNFIQTSIIGTGLAFTGINAFSSNAKSETSNIKTKDKKAGRFNMSGYRAPKLETVRIGFIGLGDRGCGAVVRMSYIEGVEIKALCDKRELAVKDSQRAITGFGLPKATEYFGSEDAWKNLCDREDIDLVYICTPWRLHTSQAVYAMEKGKHVAVEVPAATTIDECWQLVETSERTRKHCMMLENCCYDFFELLTLNMTRHGILGDLIHGEGAYIHNLLEMNFAKPNDGIQADGAYTDMWRLKENFRNGNLYPTHGLGPVCQAMNINRGDRMDFLTSMSSSDFQMKAKENELTSHDPFYKPFENYYFRGNMNTSVIKTIKGRTIMVQHDVTSTRPYSRIHLLSGTKGMVQKWPLPERVALGDNWLNEEEMKKMYEQFTPPIIQKVGEMAKKLEVMEVWTL